MDQIRKIILYKNYFKEFYISLKQPLRNKVNYILRIIETQPIIPSKFFKIIEGTNGLYEIRIAFESNIYRIFCCLDNGSLVVLFHGFQKKSAKTPPKEIEKAKKIHKDYLNSKTT